MKNIMMNPDPGGEVGLVKRVSFEKIDRGEFTENCQSNSISVSGLQLVPKRFFFAKKRSNFTENPGGVSLKNHRFIHF